MATLIQPKQIGKLLQASVFVSGLAFAAGTDANITATLTTSVSTAGDNGAAVPLQPATATAPGVIVTGNNVVQVWDASTKLKLADAGGNEVYGRLTNAGANYTLALFTLVSGVETAFTAPSVTLDFEFAYLFTFGLYPRDAAVGGSSKMIQNDPESSLEKAELLAVTAVDTLAALASAPNTSKEIVLVVNGQDVSSLVSPAPFSVAGTAITWNVVDAGYSLATTDTVVARYSL